MDFELAGARPMTLPSCPGCGAEPVDVGNFGRIKWACPNYTGRTAHTTAGCPRTVEYPMSREPGIAASYWRDAVDRMTL